MQKISDRKKHRRSRYVVGSLMLIPLIDIFTNILLFLLISYSVEGDIINADSKFLKLPVSSSRETPKMKLNIQVTADDLIIDGESIAKVKDILKDSDLSIQPMLNTLNENTKKVEFIANRNSAVKFTGEVMIQADKSIPFILLEKIMYTSGLAGYSNISLAVISAKQ